VFLRAAVFSAFCPCRGSFQIPDNAGADDLGADHPDRAPPRAPGPVTVQKTLMATSAGSASRASISSSSLTRVIEAPAMSSEVQYSPT